jgi:hypothetical protein
MTTSRVSSSIGERAFFTSVFHPSVSVTGQLADDS